jgi:hypothetical protein
VAFRTLNDLFFFGTLSKPSIIWTTELDRTTLGLCITGLSEGHEFCNARLHPTLRRTIKVEYLRNSHSLAKERFSTTIHKLPQGFPMHYMCRRCYIDDISGDNTPTHGRAWQRIAKAIDEESMRLLGVEVDLNRLQSMLGS